MCAAKRLDHPAIAFLFVVVASLIPYATAAHGEWIYDDVRYVLSNEFLKHLGSLRDCFTYHFQPTRPVADLVMALTHWWGGGSIEAHRLVSLSLHTLASVLVLSCARNLRVRTTTGTDGIGKGPALAAALFFAVNPVHTQTVTIAQFRSEMLATVFVLLAVGAQGRAWGCLGNRRRFGLWLALHFLLLLGSGLSKEAFAVIGPGTAVLCCLFGAAPRRERLTTALTAGAAGVLAVGLIACWYGSGGASSHDVAVRADVLAPKQVVIWDAHATVEGTRKIFAGQGLTNLQMAERLSAGSGFFSVGEAALIHLGTLAALAALFVWLPGMRLWCAVLALSVGVYYAIPNLNAGSEHYWYFPMVAIAVVLANLLSLVPRAGAWPMRIVGVGYLCFLVFTVHGRLGQLETRRAHAQADVEVCPRCASAWAALASESIQRGDYRDAAAQIYRGLELDPHNPICLTNVFLLYLNMRRLSEAKWALRRLEPYYRFDTQRLADLYGNLGWFGMAESDCEVASSALSRALSLDGSNPQIRAIYREFLERKHVGQWCRGVS